MQFKPAPNNLNTLRTQKVKFNDDEITYQKQISKLNSQIEKLREELTQIPNLEDQIKKLNEQIKGQEYQIQQYQLHQTNERTLQERLRTKEEVISNQEYEIKQLNSKIDELQKDLCYEKSNKLVTYQIKQPVKSLIATTQNEKTETQQELEKQLLYKTQAILKVQEKKRKMKGELKDKIIKLQSELKDYKHGYEELYKTNESLSKQLKEMHFKNGQLVSANQSYKEQLEILSQVQGQQTNRDSTDDVKYVIEIQNQRNKNLHLQQEIAQLQYNLSEAKTQAAIYLEKLKTAENLKPQNEKLRGELMLLETENERLKRKNLSDLDHIEQQIVQISLKEQKIKDQTYELELKQINLHQMIKYTNGMKEENEQLHAETEILKAQLQDLRRQFEFVEEKHEEEMRILEEKLKLQQTQTNFRIINQIPVQINSPYQIPQIERHYL